MAGRLVVTDLADIKKPSSQPSVRRSLTCILDTEFRSSQRLCEWKQVRFAGF